MAAMEHVRQWDWPVWRLRAVQYVEEYGFVTLHPVSLLEAYEYLFRV